MASPFQTCWDRTERAEFHRQSLIQIWNGLDTQDVYSSEAKVDHNGDGQYFIRTVKRDWLLPFSLQFGEMLYQLRSALDSCVYDAAALEFKQNPPPDEERWSFLIFNSPAKFDEATKRMKNLPPDLRRLMEAVQPYAGATCTVEDMRWDMGKALEYLNLWAKVDRHRRLNLVGTAVSKGNLAFALPPGSGMEVESCDFSVGAHFLEDDTEFARFRIRNYVPGTKVNVKADLAFDILVDEVPKMSRLQIAASTMGHSVSAVRESFEKHYGIVR